jgi:MerR family transcriptional regulator, light-induced transcriptional regulator
MAEYKIKDLESLTGIKAHTIRIWEKRYNLLSPCRTETNLRTYSDDDLTTILIVSVLNNHGIKISHIAEMTHSERVRRFEMIQNESVDSGAVEQFILALLNLDEHLFCQTFQDLVDLHGLEITFSDFVVPFLDRIGVMWLVGTINPAQEHFMSHLIRQKIVVAIDKLPCEISTDKKAILYLPEHEWHELGLLFYHFILKKHGWKVFYLGQSVPMEALRQVVGQLKPDLMVTSWVVGTDELVLPAHFKELKTFFSGTIASGGCQMNGKEYLGIHLLEKLTDLEQLSSKLRQ